MWSPIPGTMAATLYHVRESGVEFVRAWPTEHPMIYMVEALVPGVLNFDLFWHEDEAIRAALRSLAQRHQDITIATDKLKMRQREIEEAIRGKAKGSEVREGVDTAPGM